MLSAVAGILERGGGCRIVVTSPFRFRYHLQPGERLFVVPDFWIEEPVPWGLIPWLIGRTELHVARSIWPEPLRRWGLREAREHWVDVVLPALVADLPLAA